MKHLLITSLACLTIGSLCAQSTVHSSFIELNGQGQYLSVPASPLLDIEAGQDRSISFWVWGETAEAYASGEFILSKLSQQATDAKDRSGYEIYGYNNVAKNFMGYHLSSADGTPANTVRTWVEAAASRAELRKWYHITIVVDAKTKSEVRTYIDGELRHTQALPKDAQWFAKNTAPLFIGANNVKGQPNRYFFGRIDNLRFYSHALSTSEVKKDKQTERISKNTKNLLAAFDFDNMQIGASTLSDVTGRLTATLHGFPALRTSELAHTITTRRVNGNLIGRKEAQAIGMLTVGLQQPTQFNSLTVRLDGTTNLRDIKRLSLYRTDRGDRYDHRNPGELVASATSSESHTITLKAEGKKAIRTYDKLWLVADVDSDAKEGNKIVAQWQSMEVQTTDKKPKTYTLSLADQPKLMQEIVLERTLLYTPGDDATASYRIPGLVRLESGRLVASIDKRKNSNYDLPEDIDVEVRISDDNGKSWSTPITVAKGNPNYGYGDAAMATDGKNIYMVMVAGSGLWFYPSYAKRPLDMFYSESKDGGLTWSPVRNITESVYTDRYPNGGFFGSGNGIITSKGRIAFVAAMRTDAKWGGVMENVMVYSDDAGRTWQSSPVARANGDEAKILELTDGRLLISSRNRAGGANARTFVHSSDHGMTWTAPAVWTELMGNACNAALTRYSTEGVNGAKESILLHTLLESGKREKLRLYMSTDEGASWPISRLICFGEAAYSEVAILPDGTIGIISEENDHPAYDIYFTRVSIDWLKSGRDTSK